MNVLTGNYLNYFFRSRCTNRPCHTPTAMCAYLWGGNSPSIREYVQKHILSPNSPPPTSSLPPPLFSLILRPGAETAQLMHTHTPCNAIVKFRPDAHLDHFTPCARKQDRKMGVANSLISRYLPPITPIRAPTTPLLTLIPPNTQHACEKIRLFSYFSNLLALLNCGRAAHFSRPIRTL